MPGSTLQQLQFIEHQIDEINASQSKDQASKDRLRELKSIRARFLELHQTTAQDLISCGNKGIEAINQAMDENQQIIEEHHRLLLINERMQQYVGELDEGKKMLEALTLRYQAKGLKKSKIEKRLAKIAEYNRVTEAIQDYLDEHTAVAQYVRKEIKIKPEGLQQYDKLIKQKVDAERMLLKKIEEGEEKTLLADIGEINKNLKNMSKGIEDGAEKLKMLTQGIEDNKKALGNLEQSKKAADRAEIRLAVLKVLKEKCETPNPSETIRGYAEFNLADYQILVLDEQYRIEKSHQSIQRLKVQLKEKRAMLPDYKAAKAAQARLLREAFKDIESEKGFSDAARIKKMAAAHKKNVFDFESEHPEFKENLELVIERLEGQLFNAEEYLRENRLKQLSHLYQMELILKARIQNGENFCQSALDLVVKEIQARKKELGPSSREEREAKKEAVEAFKARQAIEYQYHTMIWKQTLPARIPIQYWPDDEIKKLEKDDYSLKKLKQYFYHQSTRQANDIALFSERNTKQTQWNILQLYKKHPYRETEDRLAYLQKMQTAITQHQKGEHKPLHTLLKIDAMAPAVVKDGALFIASQIKAIEAEKKTQLRDYLTSLYALEMGTQAKVDKNNAAEWKAALATIQAEIKSVEQQVGFFDKRNARTASSSERYRNWIIQHLLQEEGEQIDAFEQASEAKLNSVKTRIATLTKSRVHLSNTKDLSDLVTPGDPESAKLGNEIAQVDKRLTPLNLDKTHIERYVAGVDLRKGILENIKSAVNGNKGLAAFYKIELDLAERVRLGEKYCQDGLALIQQLLAVKEPSAGVMEKYKARKQAKAEFLAERPERERLRVDLEQMCLAEWQAEALPILCSFQTDDVIKKLEESLSKDKDILKNYSKTDPYQRSEELISDIHTNQAKLHMVNLYKKNPYRKISDKINFLENLKDAIKAYQGGEKSALQQLFPNIASSELEDRVSKGYLSFLSSLASPQVIQELKQKRYTMLCAYLTDLYLLEMDTKRQAENKEGLKEGLKTIQGAIKSLEKEVGFFDQRKARQEAAQQLPKPPAVKSYQREEKVQSNGFFSRDSTDVKVFKNAVKEGWISKDKPLHHYPYFIVSITRNKVLDQNKINNLSDMIKTEAGRDSKIISDKTASVSKRAVTFMDQEACTACLAKVQAFIQEQGLSENITVEMYPNKPRPSYCP